MLPKIGVAKPAIKYGIEEIWPAYSLSKPNRS